MHRIQVRLLILLAAGACAGCSQDSCPQVRERRVTNDPTIEAEYHLGKAILFMLREWNDLDGRPEEGSRAIRGKRIQTMVAALCGGPQADWRIDILATPVQEYFDLSKLPEAQTVDCVGLVVRGEIQPGPAFVRPR